MRPAPRRACVELGEGEQGERAAQAKRLPKATQLPAAAARGPKRGATKAKARQAKANCPFIPIECSPGLG
jgi:hypothetical protein